MGYYDDVLNNAAAAYGLNPDELRRVMMIESGGNPRATTGSYHGLFQLSNSEFNKYGGGDINNPVDNANAAARKMASERAAFTQQYGRQPDAADSYLIHQQGVGGAAAHMANPEAPAWQNMYSTGEGRERGPGWARQAIWGNIPDNASASPSFNKAMFPGGVDTVTSQDFMDGWRRKVLGQSAPTPAPQPLAPGTDAALAGQAGAAAGASLFPDPSTAAAASAVSGATSGLSAPQAPAAAGGLFGALGIDPNNIGGSGVSAAPTGLNIPGLGNMNLTQTAAAGQGQGDDKDSGPPPLGLTPIRRPIDMRGIYALAQPQQLGMLQGIL
jgi:hypothetical protein